MRSFSLQVKMVVFLKCKEHSQGFFTMDVELHCVIGLHKDRSSSMSFYDKPERGGGLRSLNFRVVYT